MGKVLEMRAGAGRGALWAALAVTAVLCALQVSAAAASPAPCAWAGETDQRDVNVGAPDLDAYYWMDTLAPASGTRVEIDGRYPRARYFSFHVYDHSGNALDSIYDRQIKPAAGSANPFAGRVARRARNAYAVHIEFAAKPRHLSPNALYVDPAVGPVALLVYRVYVPQHPSDPSGAVGFPGVEVQTANGQTLVTQGGCATTPPPFGSLLWEQSAAADYPAGAPRPNSASATRIPTWTRSFGNQLGNQQNAYLGSVVSRQYGNLVVIHTRAPTFPNTGAGRHVWGRHQLRYWSFCTYDENGQAAIGCAADYRAAIRRGWITYVVSDPGGRPSNATAAHGVTWLPWGGTQSTAQIVYRNMLPSPRFRHAAQRITKTGNAKRVMGSYYPTAVYCAKRKFERGGWKACFRAAGLPAS